MKATRLFTLSLTAATGIWLGGSAASHSVEFRPPADEPAPRHASGGASRGNACPQSGATDTPAAMLPFSAFGKTLLPHPTLLFYLPDTSADGAIFTLKDENNTLIYSTEIALSEETGVVAWTVPEAAPALELNQSYQWFMVFQCDGRLFPDSSYISGRIQRTTTEPQADSAVATQLEKAAALSTAGIWYDGAATLAKLHQEQPQNSDIAHHWETLLQSVGLEAFATLPVIEIEP
ncbi:MAG: DUF928 domain-containing protein [Leptolyngbya sp. SIO4C1]|nr:DUF928 domain-containing protein [Leptolyngbya sp. SIO4C1]